MSPTVSGACEVSHAVSVITIGRLKTAIERGETLVSAWQLSNQKVVRRHGEIDAGCGCGCSPPE
jgi:hypothetical protein